MNGTIIETVSELIKDQNSDRLITMFIDKPELLNLENANSATVLMQLAYNGLMEAFEKHAIWVSEIWDSKEDHDNSLKVKGVMELIGQAMPLLDGKPEKGEALNLLGGFGLK